MVFAYFPRYYPPRRRANSLLFEKMVPYVLADCICPQRSFCIAVSETPDNWMKHGPLHRQWDFRFPHPLTQIPDGLVFANHQLGPLQSPSGFLWRYFSIFFFLSFYQESFHQERNLLTCNRTPSKRNQEFSS